MCLFFVTKTYISLDSVLKSYIFFIAKESLVFIGNYNCIHCLSTNLNLEWNCTPPTGILESSIPILEWKPPINAAGQGWDIVCVVVV